MTAAIRDAEFVRRHREFWLGRFPFLLCANAELLEVAEGRMPCDVLRCPLSGQHSGRSGCGELKWVAWHLHWLCRCSRFGRYSLLQRRLKFIDISP